MSSYISVGGTALPPCTSYRVQRSDLDNNSSRDERFVMHRNAVRLGAYKIYAKFRVSRAELAVLTQAISASTLSVTFLDITTNARITKQMYAGDREGEVVNDGDEDNMLIDFSVNFIEL